MLATTIDQAGNVLDPDTYPCGRLLCRSLPFLGPEWGSVKPFALDDADRSVYEKNGFNYSVYHNPGAPPSLIGDSQNKANYHWTHSLVAVWSAHLDPADEVMVDISPASLGNVTDFPTDQADFPTFYDLLNGGDTSRGYQLNPITGLPYAPQLVPRGDYARVRNGSNCSLLHLNIGSGGCETERSSVGLASPSILFCPAICHQCCNLMLLCRPTDSMITWCNVCRVGRFWQSFGPTVPTPKPRRGIGLS